MRPPGLGVVCGDGSTTAEAPGKVLISGGYVILCPKQGVPGIVLAVDAFARCTVRFKKAKGTRAVFSSDMHASVIDSEDDPAEKHDFFEFARCALNCAQMRAGVHFGTVLMRITTDSAFKADGGKTGLGSSAAVTVATVGALLHHAAIQGLIEPVSIDEIHSVAQEAHSAASGKRGSGFDVTAACYGSRVFLDRSHHRAFRSDRLRVALLRGGGGTDTRIRVTASTALHADLPGEYAALVDATRLLSAALVVGSLRPDAFRTAASASKRLRKAHQALTAAGFEVEPKSLTAPLTAAESVSGVICALCPGAGGQDSAAVLLSPDCDVERLKAIVDVVAVLNVL